MAMIAIHHCPWQADRRSAVSLFLLALLVSPVSNGPTDASVIILAILASVFILVGSWVHFFFGETCWKKVELLSMSCSRLSEIGWAEVGDSTHDTRHASSSLEMTHNNSVSREDEDEVGGSGCIDRIGKNCTPLGTEEDEECALGGEVELESEHLLQADITLSGSNLPVAPGHPTSAHLAPALTIDNKHGEALDIKRCTKEQLYRRGGEGMLHMSGVVQDTWMTFLALVMIVLAFVCYVQQNRTNYWLSHGLWHLCAMGSTYFFIRNRDRIAKRIKSLSCCIITAGTD